MAVYKDLENKRVLITGSSSGIGAETAVQFAEQGCFVGVHYFQTRDGGEKILAAVKKLSDGCLLRADMRDKSQVDKLINDFAQAAGGIDILVNNAGSLIERQPFESAGEEYYRDIFDTNVKSVFASSQSALPHLKKTRGNIVNVSSIAAYTGGGGGSGIYASAKAAVSAMTLSMAKEFAAFGIRVNAVVPGLIETRFHEQFSTDERKRQVAAQTPLGRNGRAEDVANAILFLSSEAACFITGEYITVSGGLYMKF